MLGRLTATRIAVWRAGAHGWLSLADPPEGELPPWPPVAGLASVAGEPARLAEVAGVPGLWLSVAADGGGPVPGAAAAIGAVVARLARTEFQADLLSDELTRRYEEIDLLYGIAEVLGRPVGLEEAAAFIVREVSDVVGARRASIMVHDEAAGTLRTVAARGFASAPGAAVAVDDPRSVAARAFRCQSVLSDQDADLTPEPRGYQGGAFLSVPIRYTPPGGEGRCVGVINLTDRAGSEPFGSAHRRLVEAVATQIGAAIENARLVQRDRAQQRMRRELELAHDLQRKLLPDPAVLQGEARVAVRFDPAESVGGDFYTFSRMGLGCISVMLGDVSSHGYSAALVMAVVMAAAGIHAPAAVTPDETLAAMRDSLAQTLAETESHLTVFHGVLDPVNRRLTWASAGHPQAFRIPRHGDPERLETTAPPLGLAPASAIASRQVAWQPGEDLLCLWTDGLVDATGPGGERYGEARLLDQLSAAREEPPEEILRRVLADADAFAPRPADDRTLLVMRI